MSRLACPHGERHSVKCGPLVAPEFVQQLWSPYWVRALRCKVKHICLFAVAVGSQSSGE